MSVFGAIKDTVTAFERAGVELPPSLQLSTRDGKRLAREYEQLQRVPDRAAAYSEFHAYGIRIWWED